MLEFHHLVEKEIPRLRRYARALTRDSIRADDLVQDTLVRGIAKAQLWQAGSDCEQQHVARWHAFALCADGWALGVSGQSEKGLAQIEQGLDSFGLGAIQHMLLVLQADVQLATGRPEAALASASAGLKAVEK